MKHLLTLTEYNLRAIKKPLLWMLLLMGPAQLLFNIFGVWFHGLNLFRPPYMHFFFGMVVPALCMILAALMNFSSILRQNGRSKAIYTLMTLPCSRSCLFFSQVLSGVIAVWAVIAVQGLWYIILYYPTAALVDLLSVQWLNNLAEAGLLRDIPTYGSSFVQNGLFLSMMRAPAMRFLFPTDLYSLLSVVICVFCPTICLTAIPCRRGFGKILCSVLFVICAATALSYIFMNVFDFVNFYHVYNAHMILFMLTIQIVAAFVTCILALLGLQHAKNL